MQTSDDHVQTIQPQEETSDLLKTPSIPSPPVGTGDGGDGATSKEDPTTLEPPMTVPTKSDATGTDSTAPAMPDVAPSSDPMVTAQQHPGAVVPAPAAPPTVKRFTSATISKKFMQQATSGTNKSSSGSANKTQNPGSSSSSRPAQPTPTGPPSRLVTAKLTTAAVPSASSTGWNTPRPGSAVATANPSPAQTPGVSHSGNKQLAGSPNGMPSADRPSGLRNNPPGKPWGDVQRPTSVVVATATEDFPTAAEVARGKPQGRGPKPANVQAEEESTSPPSDGPLSKTADAFRGVHLDPKGPHWDDDDDGGDDFLGTVLDFGDGTQYSVPPTATAETAPDLPGGPSPFAKDSDQTSQPVRKEDRFADDFDRSWPRGPSSRRAPSLTGSSPRPPLHEVASPAPSHSSTLHSDRERDKVLFNERSNRMEPIAGSNNRPAWVRKESEGVPNGRPVPPHLLTREPPPHGGRDLPPHSATSQRPYTGRPAWPDRGNSIHAGRRPGDMPPPPGPPVNSMDGPAWGRNSTRRLSNTSRDGGLGLSMGHHGPPPSFRGGEVDRDLGRHHPPHFVSGAPSRMEPPSPGPRYVSDRRPSESATSQRPFMNGRRESISSNVSRSPVVHTSAPVEKPLVPLEAQIITPMSAVPPPTPGGLDLDGVTKLTMHSAAERAKIRRQEEEEEREKQRQRARAKAAALEAQFNARQETERAQERAAAAIAAEAENKRLAEESEQLKRIEELRIAKEMDEKERKLREAKETERPAIVAAGRPKLQLLPRTVPIPTTVPILPLEQETPRVIPPTSNKPLDSSADDQLLAPLPGSVMTHAVHFLDGKHDEDIEEVDFKDMEDFMAPPSSSPTVSITPSAAPSTRRRPVAMDFFDESQVAPVTVPSTSGSPDEHPPSGSARQSDATATPISPSHKPSPLALSPTFSPSRSSTITSPALRSPFREAPMSSLSETLSRFKGVLQTLHSPPAEGGKSLHEVAWPITFALSKTPAPIPTPNTECVILNLPTPPTTPSARLRPSQDQIRLAKYPVPIRRDHLMTFDPPIAELRSSTLSRDELLVAGKSRAIRISIPKFQPPSSSRSAKVRLPQVSGYQMSNAPPQGAVFRGGLGRGAGVDEANWRRPPREMNSPAINLPVVAGVNAVSRSPPPTMASSDDIGTSILPLESARDQLPSPAASSRGGKGKRPDGAEVAFYRSPSSDVAPPSVHFMVTSEIDGPVIDESLEEHNSYSSGEQQSDEKASQETPTSQSTSALLTPPTTHALTSWSKSPLGFPLTPETMESDPEKIKAVWEHSSPKGTNMTENSLKNIADDLPAPISQTAPELKSEDGGRKPGPVTNGTTAPAGRTDPPAPRMSLQDAHRGFQMVPPSPAGNPRQPNFNASSNPMPPPSRTADPPQPHPSPYMMPRHQPLPSPSGYHARPFAPAPPMNPNGWTQPSPYMANAQLAPRMPPPSSNGPSPPLPQGSWMPPPQQQMPSPYMAPAQFTYMQQPQGMPQQGMKPGMGQPNLASPPNLGGQNFAPQGHRPPPPPMNYQNSGPMNNLGQPPHQPVYPPRQPMMPHPMYGGSPNTPSPGYGVPPAGMGRGMVRNGFELPPPATPTLYPQMQQRFHTPGW